MATIKFEVQPQSSAKQVLDTLVDYAKEIHRLDLELSELHYDLTAVALEKETIEAAVNTDVYADKAYSNDAKRKAASILILSDSEEWTTLNQRYDDLKKKITDTGAERALAQRLFSAYQLATKVAIVGLGSDLE
jgi:hypothetical protein